jgi:hypothetical protein
MHTLTSVLCSVSLNPPCRSSLQARSRSPPYQNAGLCTEQSRCKKFYFRRLWHASQDRTKFTAFYGRLRLHENSPNSLKASHFSLSCIDPASFLAAAVEIFVSGIIFQEGTSSKYLQLASWCKLLRSQMSPMHDAALMISNVRAKQQHLLSHFWIGFSISSIMKAKAELSCCQYDYMS